jgi:hypothetical protein
MSRTPDERIKRIQPDRRWFGNVRVVGQSELQQFRETMGAKVNDPYTVVMRSKKLPMGLLQDGFKVRRTDRATNYAAGAAARLHESSYVRFCASFPLMSFKRDLFLILMRANLLI